MGSAASAVADLSVQPSAPVIVRQPQSRGAFAGFGVGFNVQAEGTEPLQYQWQFNGSNLDGATATDLVVNPAQVQNSGSYRVVVNNSLGSATSEDALLTIIPVAAWGGNVYGQTNLSFGLSNIVAISAGANHNLALRRDGTVLAWGSSVSTNVPASLTNAIAISGGGAHSLALTSQERLWRGETIAPDKPASRRT